MGRLFENLHGSNKPREMEPKTLLRFVLKLSTYERQFFRFCQLLTKESKRLNVKQIATFVPFYSAIYFVDYFIIF